MKAVQQIIDILGGMEALKNKPIRLEAEGFMTLVIEYVGKGPNGLPEISVAHYYEQNSDLMADPEITFEVSVIGWYPLTFQQANLGIYQEAVMLQEDGQIVVNTKLVKYLDSFAALWSRNLIAQGFIDAATELAKTNIQKP